MKTGPGAASGLAIGVLGPVSVHAAGEPVAIAQPGLRVLLAVLALSAGRVVPAGALVEAMWRDEASRQRERNLHTRVYQLRKLLAQAEPKRANHRLVTEPPGYRLVLAEGELDTSQFTALAARGRQAARSGDHSGAGTHLRAALALWRGPALADVAGLSARLEAEAAALEEQRMAVLDDRAEADLAAGRHRELAAELVGLVSQYPLRERLRCQLMLALYRSGRQADALATYQQGRDILAKELGIDPGSELRDLHQRMLRADPGLAAPARGGTAKAHDGLGGPAAIQHFAWRDSGPRELDARRNQAAHPGGTVVMTAIGGTFGKEQELARIARIFAERRTGPAAILIEGDAGIGKTTLWDAALHLARDRSLRVLAARPAEAEMHFSYGAARDLLIPLLDETIDALPGPQQRAVETAFLRAEGRTDAHAVSAGVLGILRAASASGPIVMGIDDLQWLDAASARVLEFAFRRLTREDLTVLAASRYLRPGLVGLQLERAFGVGRLSTLVLGQMPIGDMHRLLHDRLGTWFPRPVLRRLHAASGGNPFFALEMARGLVLKGMPASTEALPVPGTLGEIVRDRLASLSTEARETLLVVSAAPRAPVALVSAVARPGDQTIAGLAEAEDEGILIRRGDRLEFSHPVLASVVYSQIPAARRRSLHRALADALASSATGAFSDSAARAWHLALGAEGPDAAIAGVLDEAAASDRLGGAPEAAAKFAELARRLTPTGHDEERARRTVELAQYLFEAGDTTMARSELAALVAQMAPGPDRAPVLLRLAMVLYHAQSCQAARDTAEQAVAEAGTDTSTLAEAHAMVAQLSDASNLERDGHARKALELLGGQDHPDPRILSSALLALAMARYYTGRGVSRSVLEKAIELEKGLAERPGVSWRAGTVLGEFLKYTDDFEGARTMLEAAHREAREEGDESSLPDILGHLSELELWSGDWELAARYAQESVEAAELTGQGLMVSVNCYGRGIVNAHLGLVALARSDAEAGLASAEERGDPWAVGINLWVLGFLELSLGRLAEASRYLSQAWEIGESIGLGEPGQWRFHPDHLEALIGMGELDRAEDLLIRFEERARLTGRSWALATAARCRALLLAASGDPGGAAAALEQALAHHERVPMPFELARTLLCQGQLRRRVKQKRAARESLEAAIAIFERLGASLWAERASLELRRVGLRPPAPLELTVTEERVADLAAAGQTNREIAQALFLSVHTVEDNLRRVYRKLAVRSRTELAAQRLPDPSAASAAQD